MSNQIEQKINTSIEDSLQAINKSMNSLPKVNLITRFLWVCSGANREILLLCPSDYTKYAGIGGTILFTSLLAMMSGGYALFTVFDRTWLATLFGIFWGLLIFNLDRFMVNTMYTDGEHTISLAELKAAAPRIILAIFLGVVISTPLEMKIFNDKIEAELQIKKSEKSKEIDEKNKIYESDVLNLETAIAALKNTYRDLEYRYQKEESDFLNQINEMEKNVKKAREDWQKEVNGAGITGKRGEGKIARSNLEQLERDEKNVEYLKSQLEEMKATHKNTLDDERQNKDRNLKAKENELDNAKQLRDSKKMEKETAIDAGDGFSARLEALYAVTSEGVLFWGRLMIMLLFICVEVIPTFFKLMLESGVYDSIQNAQKVQMASITNSSVNTTLEIDRAKNMERLEQEVKANKELIKKVAEAQSEILSLAIDEWREMELKRVKKNPGNYVKQTLSTPGPNQQSTGTFQRPMAANSQPNQQQARVQATTQLNNSTV